MPWYHLNVTVHVLAALLWLGGMFFFVAVGAPVLRRLEPDLRSRLFREMGLAFRRVGWIAIGVLVTTGVLNLWMLGYLRASVLGSPAFWSTPYGIALGWKLGLVALMLTLSAVHDFVVGPRSASAPPGSPRAAKLRRLAVHLARMNALAGVVLIYVAVRLARGG